MTAATLQTYAVILALLSINASAYYPVICVPGIFSFKNSIERLCQQIGQLHNGTSIKYIQLDKSFLSTLAMWEQVKLYRHHFNRMFSKYPDGVNIVAHSQGTLISRAIIETTPNHPVKNFISVFGPFMGTFGIPKSKFEGIHLPQLNDKKLEDLSDILYQRTSQATISIAGYWNDPNQKDLFLTKCKFLPYINNLIPHPHVEEYKTNIEALNKLVLIGSDGDDVIYPWQSEVGGYYNESFDIIPLQDQDVYINNLFGLKTLDDRGDLVLIEMHNVSTTGVDRDVDMVVNDILPYCT